MTLVLRNDFNLVSRHQSLSAGKAIEKQKPIQWTIHVRHLACKSLCGVAGLNDDDLYAKGPRGRKFRGIHPPQCADRNAEKSIGVLFDSSCRENKTANFTSKAYRINAKRPFIAFRYRSGNRVAIDEKPLDRTRIYLADPF